MKLLFLRFRLIWQNSVGATLLLLLSFAAGFFCLNIFVGYGETQYGYAINDTKHNTITIIDTGNKLGNIELLSYLKERTAYRISDVLYLSKIENDHFLIGWEGLNQGPLWFPSGTGRFFTQEEIDSNEGGIIYLSENLYSLPGNMEIYKTNGFEYKVIGSSLVMSLNLTTCDVTPYCDFWDGCSAFPKLEILPYKSFLKRDLSPTLIYLHMRGYTTKERVRIVGELQQILPDVMILTDETFDSEQFRLKTLILQTRLGVPFSALIWISLSSAFFLWLERNKKVNKVLKICGVSVAEDCVQILFMLFLMVLLGECAALLLQAALWPVLSQLDVKRYPPPVYLLGSSVFLFLFVALVNFGGILRMARRVRESG